MDDMIPSQPDIADLFQVAAGQQGFFTSQQAHESGVSSDLVKYHLRSGRFIREYRGVYRFRDYPSSSREFVMAAWLATGKDIAVVSHESALDLLDLTDIIPGAIHITVARQARYAREVPGVILHTTTNAIRPDERQIIDGIAVTTPTRTIIDVTNAGISPEHVEVAVAQALEHGVTTIRRLRESASSRSKRVRKLIDVAISSATD